MGEQKYIYWCVGMLAVEDTRGWECVMDNSVYMPRGQHREGEPFSNSCTYRKPVTDAEYRAHHGMLVWPCDCPEGYRVTAFGIPTPDSITLSALGTIRTGRDNYSVCPILEKIEPEIEWVTPTDEDARHRPWVEVCDHQEQLELGHGRKAKLLGVAHEGFFVTKTGSSWMFCRMDAKLREGWA
jgi:hypothetical protein